MFEEIKKVIGQAQTGLSEEERKAQLKKVEELKKAEEERKAREEERVLYQESVLQKFDAFLDEQNKKDGLPDTKTEIVTITTDGILLDNEGYKYIAILNPTNATVTLKVDALGIIYEEVLQKGYNKLNLINNSILKVASNTSNTSVILIRTDVQPV